MIPSLTVSDAFQRAFEHHQAGRLAEAETLYRQILAVQPDHIDTLHFLGVLANQAGRPEVAVHFIGRAVALHPDDASARSNLGAALATANRWPEAIAQFHRALQLDPQLGEIHYNLGDALRKCGRTAEAVAAYRRATELLPNLPEPYHRLGIALAELNQLDQAMDAYRTVLRVDSRHAAAHNNLGDLLRRAGRPAEALSACEQAVQIQPGMAEAHKNLADALLDLGQAERAIDVYHRSLALKPDYAEAYNNLANALCATRQFDEADAAYRRALTLRPAFPEAWSNLAHLLKKRGQLETAILAYRQALQLRPAQAAIYNDFGNALHLAGDLTGAIAAYHQALQLQPQYAEAESNLGNVLRDGGQLEGAIAAGQRALALKPDFAEACNNLGNALNDSGDVDGAIDAYRRALQIEPRAAWVHSNLVYTLHYHAGSGQEAIAAELQRWERKFAAPWQPFIRAHRNDRSPDRPLRVGYVSPDFRFQAEAFFVAPLLESHDHQHFQIHCYASVARPDGVTERLRRSADVWHDVYPLSDEDLAAQIRADGMDILVDLTMHMAGNRLPVFARQPAPVQVAWLAYAGSTGLPTMDYRVTDRYLDPPETATPYCSERSIRLPDCWCCYDPLGEAPPVNDLPALTTNAITFACLNNFCKMNAPTLELFARVLGAVERSRLLLLAPEGRARQRVLAHLQRQGIAAERIEFVEKTARPDYLRRHHAIDIALDTLPYNGHTTTCDALWMGVPVVSLAGQTAVGRVGLGLLSTVGLAEMATRSEDEFVRTAIRLANDRPALAELRRTLRGRMQSSPLMDPPRFARHMEAAYRMMWRRWCAAS